MPSLIPPSVRTAKKAAENFVCKIYKITPSVIHSKSRAAKNTHARYAVWYILRKKNGLSLAVIGELYGRHHTVISDGIARAQKIGIVADLGISVLKDCEDDGKNGGKGVNSTGETGDKSPQKRAPSKRYPKSRTGYPQPMGKKA